MPDEFVREVAEGRQYQGEDEEIVYTVDVANWGDSPSSPSVVVKEISDNYNPVTSVVMPSGSPTVAANIITLPTLKSLTRSKAYRVETKFTLSGNILECYFDVQAQR